MYRYDNYTDSFVRIDGEPNTGSTTVRVGVPLKETAVTIKKVELTDECIDKIADAVVRKLADRKTEPISHDDYVETENDHLEARCLNCNNAKTCKEKHWEGCVYEPKDEKTCESCRHWKYIAREWQCETTKCQGYTPKTEPNSSEKANNCETCKHYMFTDIDGYYCEHETYGQPCQYAPKDESQTDWKDQMWAEAVEQREHDMLYEPTYDLDDGSM